MLDDRDATLHFKLGYALEKDGNLIGAIQAYQAAVARDASHARWHYRLGRVLERTGQHDAARHAYRVAERRSRWPPSLKGVRGKQLPYRKRIELGLLPKAAYAYGLLRSARDAKALGIGHITAVELGVAGGRGLLRLEQHAADVEAMTGIRIAVYGFDTGEGLLAAVDHRDMPYEFAAGNYRMDVDALRARLQRAELVIGDATQTFPDLLASDAPTLGFVSFDMDHYSPTAGVLAHLADRSVDERLLPRTPLYFDDVIGRFGRDYNDFTGELLAIHEFNEHHESVKIAEDRYFRSLPLNFGWHHCLYVMHRFTHPKYDSYIGSDGAASLSLR